MINKVILQGRLVAKPELKDVGGFVMTEVTVAWNEKRNERENKCFLRCKAWRTTAEFMNKYFDKGQEIVIEGQLHTEEWEKDGQKQSRTVCNVEKVNFCGSKNSNVINMPVQTNDSEFMNIPDNAVEELPFK